MEGGFCYNLGQAIVSHEVDKPPSKIWLGTSTLHAISLPVETWEVEVATYLDMAVGFVANLC